MKFYYLMNGFEIPGLCTYFGIDVLELDLTFKDRKKTITIGCIVNILTEKWSV
jgi:hypothetical protein